MKTQIKVGFLISYDYELLFTSMIIVYDFVDTIYLVIDSERKTFSGENYNLPDSFFERVKEMDVADKIVFFEEPFYSPTRTAIENETRERNLLSMKMGSNCWKMQIDVDEFFADFKAVTKFLDKHSYLLSHPQCNAVNLRANWVTLFKQTPNGFLYIDNKEHFSFATNVIAKHYFGRDLTSIDNREIATNFIAVHQSWARKPEEVYQKITNWGHKNDFDIENYFNFWLSVSEDNYVNFVDLHPFHPKHWKCLKFMPCGTLAEFTKKYAEQHQPLETVLSGKYYRRYLKNNLKFYLGIPVKIQNENIT